MAKPKLTSIELTKEQAMLVLEGLLQYTLQGGDTFSWNFRVMTLCKHVADTFGITEEELDDAYGEEKEIANKA